VENLLFATEERLLSPDSVRLLYHESGGQVKHNPPLVEPGPSDCGRACMGAGVEKISKIRGSRAERGAMPLSDVSHISDRSASLLKEQKRTAGRDRYEAPGLLRHWVAPARSGLGSCVAAANLATFSAGGSRSHAPGHPGQQNATFCPSRIRIRLGETFVACIGETM